MKEKENLVGRDFDRLHVLRKVDAPKDRKYDKCAKDDWYECICSCKEHNKLIVHGSSLRSKNTKSCGCLRKETSAKTLENTKKKFKENGRKVVPTSSLRLIEFNGETKTLTEWAKDIGITKQALSLRLDSNWSIEEALTTNKGDKKNAKKS